MIINCRLLSIPKVLADDKNIVFPYKKAEALFYYLILKKQSFRETLVDMFWGYDEEEFAKKSLRNAVYVVNKTFNQNVLISPKRAIVMVNPDIRIDCDIDLFIEDKECKYIDLYKGDFLEGFFVKDSEGFERWVEEKRNEYKDIFIQRLQNCIQNAVSEKNLDKVEQLCKKLISVDEFNERAYRILMNVYKKKGLYDKGIEVYNNLSQLLKMELSITPDVKTNELLGEIVREKTLRYSKQKSVNEDFFYGREIELSFLDDNMYKFLKDLGAQSIIIEGEVGIGKTTLLLKYIKSSMKERVIIFKSNCFEIEENYFLKPWNNILLQISNYINKNDIKIPQFLNKMISCVFPGFDVYSSNEEYNEDIDIVKYQVAQNAIIDLIFKILNGNKFIFVFEDIHWIDAMSLSLISQIMMKDNNKNFLFILTYRKGYSKKIEKFKADLKMFELIKIIELKRFNEKETLEFVDKCMPGFNKDTAILLFNETEGNPLFITEYLNNIKNDKKMNMLSSKLQDVLYSRYMSLSEEAKKILNIISIFYNGVSLRELLKISEKNEIDLIEIIEELEEKNVIHEYNELDDIIFQFTHQKLREYVYSLLTNSKRKILHMKASRMIEERLFNDKRDCLIYSNLIYHFEQAGLYADALKYRIKNIKYYLDFSHEVFPAFYDERATLSGFIEIKDEEIKGEIERINDLILKVKNNQLSSEIERLEITFMHIVGRDCIRSGNYKKGIKIIMDMINKAISINDYEYVIKGYKQMIYYGINKYDVEIMDKYIIMALDTARLKGMKEEYCILLRLKGMQKIMEGKFQEGEDILKKAITVFESLDESDRFVLNIAACYNFIGECKRKSMEFYNSFYYYNKAISLCEERNIILGLPVFYANAGQAAYDMGDCKSAEKYLSNAIKYYKKERLMWGRAIAYGFMTLILIKNKDHDNALKCLLEAEDYSNIMENPYEKGVMIRIKAEIRKNMEFDSKLKSLFSEYIDKTVMEYCDEGIALLKGINNCYEIDLLENLKSSWI